MIFDQKKRFNILAIGAHGDDIELACGGTLAEAVKKGHVVKMIIISGKESHDHNEKPIRTKTQAESEIKNAAKKLGVKDFEILGFSDKLIPYSYELISRLDQIICDFDPDIIFTHFAFDTHQDHLRTAQSTISAARRRNAILLYEPINPSGQGYVHFRAQMYVDISGSINQKIESLKAHKSQYEKYSESWIDAVKARAKFRGYEMNTKYAECFEVVRFELILE